MTLHDPDQLCTLALEECDGCVCMWKCVFLGLPLRMAWPQVVWVCWTHSALCAKGLWWPDFGWSFFRGMGSWARCRMGSWAKWLPSRGKALCQVAPVDIGSIQGNILESDSPLLIMPRVHHRQQACSKEKSPHQGPLAIFGLWLPCCTVHSHGGCAKDPARPQPRRHVRPTMRMD